MKNLNQYIIEKLHINKFKQHYYIIYTSNSEGYDIKYDILDNENDLKNYHLENGRNIDATFECNNKNIISELIKRWQSLPIIYSKAHSEFNDWIKENNIKRKN
jgi:hypothetical protein